VRGKKKGQSKQKLTGARAVVVRVCNILSLGILILVAAVAAGLLIVQALGFKPLAVLSGSMEPSYAPGSVVFVDTNADVEAIALGDTITYSVVDGGTVVTHRVIAIDFDDRLFTTKGDANENEDGPVPFNSFIGKTANFSIPWVGTLLLMMGTTRGIAITLFALAFIVILLMVPIILASPKPSKADGGTAPTGQTGQTEETTVKAIEEAEDVRAAERTQSEGGIQGAHFRAGEWEAS
jgi:signal peptidase